MRIVIALLFCFLSSLSHASEIDGIIFQPREADLTIPVENWPKIFKLAKARGFNTLVIQWTRFDNVFASPQNQIWLQDRMLEAVEANLKLVIGLSSDPDTFERLKQPAPLVGSYFRKLNELNLNLAQQWVKVIPAKSIIGWYLPLEVDDRQWRDLAARAELTRYLKRQVSELGDVLPVPVYISSFFSGNMTPERYAVMLENVEAQSKVHFWVQNGSGTVKLIQAERDLYLDAIAKCSGYAATGLIYEIFTQTQADRVFAAKPLSAPEMSKALQQRSPCNGDRVFFALNYLIDFSNPK
jgi:hypothetical protein